MPLARLHLYNYLDELQTRCLYYDTDSVIYTCLLNEQPLPVGDYLGDLTDEYVSDYGTFSITVNTCSHASHNFQYADHSTKHRN